ncbi:MAG: hypothetical protein WCI18_02660 [Pseudomonadota bacterium]
MFYSTISFLLVAIYGSASCSNQNSSKEMKRRLNQGSVSSSNSSENANKSTEQNSILVNSEVSGNGAGLQVKNSQLLSSSIDTCLGENMALVKDDMIVTGVDSKGFLNKDLYKVNSNAITVAGKDLLSKETENRLSTNSDSLSINYLGSINTVADVVADNCTPANKLCQCDTIDTAKQMMARCLPSISPKHELYESVALEFQQACLMDPKKAVASMLASYAFIISR